MSDGGWRIVFLTAAIFNWIVGLSQVVDMSGTAASMGLETLRFDPFYSPLLGWFIILFGVFYFAVSRDLENRVVVVIGTIGKLGVFAYIIANWVRGEVPGSIAALTVGDFIYSILFIAFLVTRHPAAPSKS